MTPGDALRRAREQAGLSQHDLARRAGIAQTLLSRYERGTAALSWLRLERLLASLDQQPVIALEPLHAQIDAAIDALAALSPEGRLAHERVAIDLMTQAFDQHVTQWAIDGPLAALLQGVPVPVRFVDVVVPDDDEVLTGVAKALRAAIAVFHDLSPAEVRTESERAWWPFGETDFFVVPVQRWPQTFRLEVADRVVPVVALAEVSVADPIVRRAMQRAIERFVERPRPG